MEIKIELNYWNKDNKKCYTKKCENKPTNLIYCKVLSHHNVYNVEGKYDFKNYLLVCDNCTPKYIKEAIKNTREIEDLFKNI